MYLASLRSGFDLHFEKEQDHNHQIYLQAHQKALDGRSRIIPGGEQGSRAEGFPLMQGKVKSAPEDASHERWSS